MIVRRRPAMSDLLTACFRRPRNTTISHEPTSAPRLNYRTNETTQRLADGSASAGAEAAKVTGQAFGDPGAVQVLKQRDRHPAGGAQCLAGLRCGERLRQLAENAGCFLVGAGGEHHQVGYPEQQSGAGGGREGPGIEAELAEPFGVRRGERVVAEVVEDRLDGAGDPRWERPGGRCAAGSAAGAYRLLAEDPQVRAVEQDVATGQRRDEITAGQAQRGAGGLGRHAGGE